MFQSINRYLHVNTESAGKGQDFGMERVCLFSVLSSVVHLESEQYWPNV